MRWKEIQIPIYFGDLLIIQTSDFKDIEKKYDLEDVSTKEALSFRYPHEDGYSRYVLSFLDPTNSRAIAHECLHFIDYVFDDRGIETFYSNDEHQCYFMGWVVGECHKFLNIDDSEL